MSCVPATAANTEAVCANCGKEGRDDATKLKNCTACFLVKYCGVDCQKVHRRQHKKACNQRAAELKDKRLYSQGTERSEKDFCPLCLQAVPFPMQKYSRYYACCTTMVCKGCIWASFDQKIDGCPFCRSPLTKENDLTMLRARVASKDPEAIRQLGAKYHSGQCGLKKDSSRAVELWSEAADLGSKEALLLMGFAH